MFLGAIIKEYRNKNKITMEEFAKKSNLSKGYISMLEKNYNPKTKQGITPTFQTFKCIAKAMCIDVNTLINLLDDEQIINISDNPFLTKEQIFLNLYRKLNDSGKEKAQEYITDLSEQEKYIK